MSSGEWGGPSLGGHLQTPEEVPSRQCLRPGPPNGLGKKAVRHSEDREHLHRSIISLYSRNLARKHTHKRRMRVCARARKAYFPAACNAFFVLSKKNSKRKNENGIATHSVRTFTTSRTPTISVFIKYKGH